MNGKNADTRRLPTPGRAVDDEDADQSPMDGVKRREEASRPPDIERLEKDRAKSTGTAPAPLRRSEP